MTCWKNLILLLLLSAWPSTTSGTTLSGRFTTAVYTFERALQDTVTSTSVRAYQTGRIRVKGIGMDGLSFRAYGRVANELGGGIVGDPSYRLYHGYFQYRETKHQISAKLGRQTILSGVGVGRIDGLRLNGQISRFGDVEFYVGALVAGGREGISSWHEGHMYGGRFISDPVGGTVLGLSYYRRNREATPYQAEYRIAAGLSALEIKPGEVEQEMLGVDLRRKFGPLSGYFRWDISIPGVWKTRRVEGVLRYRRGPATLSADFIHRTPYINRNSLLSVFAQSGNQESSFRGTYRFNRHLGVFGAASIVDYASEKGLRINIGAQVLNGVVGYVGRRGAGGVSDGVSSVFRKTLHERAWAEASLNLTRFKTHEAGGTRSMVASETLGLHFRATPRISLALQGQNLSQDLELATRANPFQGNGHDLRFFFSATGWFFAKGEGR